MALLYYAVSFVVFAVLLRKYRERQWGKCKNKVKLRGKLAIVTGANSGIGFEIAKELAVREADVIFACRNLVKAQNAIDVIKNKHQITSKLIPLELDLGSLKSIQTFVKTFKDNYKKLNILVNNAGISLPKNKISTTEDGFETHFGVNHMGHFLLTVSLLDTMKNSDTSRIIIISSLLHEKAELNLKYIEPQQIDDSKQINLYASSKLANMYFCRELAQKLIGSCVRVYSVCPGWAYTGLFRHHEVKWFHYFLVLPIALLYMRSAKQGAQTAIYCATETSLENENGYLYRDCKKYTSKHNFDPTMGKTLWDLSEKLLRERGIDL